MNIKDNGCIFIVEDACGKFLRLEVYQADILSSQLAHFKKDVSDLAAQVTAKVETEFLKKYPEALSTDGFLKSCEAFFENGIENVDWNAVESTLQATIKYFYEMDISKFGSAIIEKLMNDSYFFVSAKEEGSGKLVGFLMAAITPGLPKGTMKLINLIVEPNQLNCGIEQRLMGTLLEVLPQVTRIFSMVRPTNETLLYIFESSGFIQNNNPIQDPQHPIDMRYMIVLEYNAEEKNVLQKLQNNSN